jgi:hypothetical protein
MRVVACSMYPLNRYQPRWNFNISYDWNVQLTRFGSLLMLSRSKVICRAASILDLLYFMMLRRSGAAAIRAGTSCHHLHSSVYTHKVVMTVCSHDFDEWMKFPGCARGPHAS